MTSKRWAIVIAVALLFMTSSFAISALVQDQDAEDKEKAVIQYKLVPIPAVMSQAQFQAALTAQGNAGWRFLGPYAVGTGPIPNQAVLLFSKP